jgi:hypothetical protein
VVPGWAVGIQVAFVDQDLRHCTAAAAAWLETVDEKRQCPSCSVFVGPDQICTDDETWQYCCFGCREAFD